MNKIKNGLVVVNYNDYKTTKKFIESIKDYDILDLIVIVDNHSTDNSYKELLKYENHKIKMIGSPNNGGYGAGNNIGIRYLINKLNKCNIIISNPDVEVSENALISIFDSLNMNNNYAIVAPVVFENGNENKGWKLPSISKDILLNIPYIHRLLRKKLLFYKEMYYNNRYVLVDAVSGCFFAIKSDVIESINFYDENMFLYYEENVLGSKIKKINMSVIVDTSLSVIHHHSISIDASFKVMNKYKILKKSQMYYHDKYNNANFLDKFLLYVTSKITYFVLYIYHFVRGGKK